MLETASVFYEEIVLKGSRSTNPSEDPTPRRLPASSGERIPSPGERVHALDAIRGVSILAVILVHRMHYDWTVMASRNGIHGTLSGAWSAFLVGVIALFTMAGIFYLISGTANAVSAIHRLQAQKTPPGRIIATALTTGVWFMALHYLYRLFLMNGFVPSPGAPPTEFPAGQLTGLLRYGKFPPLDGMQLTDPSTLSLIGINTATVVVVFGLAFRRQSPLLTARRALVWIAAVVWLLYPGVSFFCKPLYAAAHTAGNLPTAFWTAFLCKDFGIFPYLAHAATGALAGLILAEGRPGKATAKHICRLSFSWMGAGLGALGTAGILHLCHLPGVRESGAAGILAIQLGLFLLILRATLPRFHFRPDTAVRVNRPVWIWVRRFGRMSLTIYLFEPLVGEGLAHAWRGIFGPQALASPMYMLLLVAACIVAWSLLLAAWRRIGYAGSAEWLYGVLMKGLSLKNSRKTEWV